MWIDPIVEELHRERERRAAEFGYDVYAYFRHIQQLEKQEKDHPLVYPPAREERKRPPAA